MRGIIVKPAPCCGNTSALGTVVDVVEKTPIGQLVMCPACNVYLENFGAYVRVDLQGKVYNHVSVLESRIKYFDSDLDKEIEMESNEDLIKEKEEV